MSEPVIFLVVLVVVGVPVIALLVRNTMAERRLPEAEKRRRAAIKRWGGKGGSSGSDWGSTHQDL